MCIRDGVLAGWLATRRAVACITNLHHRSASACDLSFEEVKEELFSLFQSGDARVRWCDFKGNAKLDKSRKKATALQ